MKATILAVTFAILGLAAAQHDPHFTNNRTSIVHLFEWRWNDIANECEQFLAPYGYAAVQTSPPNENAVITNDPEQPGKIRPWWERYQPVSYKLETRSGTEEEFKSMVQRCNAVGVRVFIDAVINHMTMSYYEPGVGTGGSPYNPKNFDFPGVPFSYFDFNEQGQCPSPDGRIRDDHYWDPIEVRNCKLGGLTDLNHGQAWVRDRVVEYLNKLVGYGVGGFRIDASKHMWTEDMKLIFDGLVSLPVEHGFPSGARPFVYQEVIDNGGEGVEAKEYYHLGYVTEFKACANIGRVMRRWSKEEGAPPEQLSYVKNWGEGEGTGWGYMPSGVALTFVDNHDNQRGHGAGGDTILNFKSDRLYKMAQAFVLAWPYGITRIMSSYKFDVDWTGPPTDADYNTLPVTTNPDLTCNDGWVCEHRWRQIYNMVQFRNVVGGTGVDLWWDNQSNQIAFSRGDRAFLAINNDDYAMTANIPTLMPAGTYCDIITGNLVDGACTGKYITVRADGTVEVNISNAEADPMIAITIESKFV